MLKRFEFSATCIFGPLLRWRCSERSESATTPPHPLTKGKWEHTWWRRKDTSFLSPLSLSRSGNLSPAEALD